MTEHTRKAMSAIVDEACEWLVRLNEPDLGDRDKNLFAKWLQQSPQHVQAYLKAEATWFALEQIDPQRDTDVDALLQEATNVIELDKPQSDSNTHTDSGPRQHSWLAIAASMVLVITCAGVFTWLQRGSASLVYETGLGEQRRVVLEDGSVVELNTQSVIHVAIGEHARNIDLVKGEALFDVAKDKKRPFTVSSHDTQVQAVGTQFNVYRQSEQTVVTVLEGRVKLMNRDLPSQRNLLTGDATSKEPLVLQLREGEQVKVHNSTREPVIETVAEAERAVAWRERRLIFENDTLIDVINEFNRYNRQQVIINDSVLGAQRISGVFDADRPETIVRFLRQTANIEVAQVSELKMLLIRKK